MPKANKEFVSLLVCGPRLKLNDFRRRKRNFLFGRIQSKFGEEARKSRHFWRNPLLSFYSCGKSFPILGIKELSLILLFISRALATFELSFCFWQTCCRMQEKSIYLHKEGHSSLADSMFCKTRNFNFRFSWLQIRTRLYG